MGDLGSTYESFFPLCQWQGVCCSPPEGTTLDDHVHHTVLCAISAVHKNLASLYAEDSLCVAVLLGAELEANVDHAVLCVISAVHRNLAPRCAISGMLAVALPGSKLDANVDHTVLCIISAVHARLLSLYAGGTLFPAALQLVHELRSTRVSCFPLC